MLAIIHSGSLWIILLHMHCQNIQRDVYLSHIVWKGTLTLCGLKSFKCACPATQKGQGCHSLSEASSKSLLCEQTAKLWRETARMCRLAWVFAVCLCGKYPFLMCRLIWWIVTAMLNLYSSDWTAYSGKSCLHLSRFNNICPHSTTFVHIQQYLSIFNNICPCLTIFVHIQQHLSRFNNIYPYSTCVQIQQYLSIFSSNRLGSTIFIHIQRHLSIFNNICPYSTTLVQVQQHVSTFNKFVHIQHLSIFNCPYSTTFVYIQQN